MGKHDELKPCPMCGSDFLRISEFEEYVACDDCGTLGPSRESETEAIAAWNCRSASPEVTAIIDAATALRDQIAIWNDGGPAAGPDESKSLFDALNSALAAWEKANV